MLYLLVASLEFSGAYNYTDIEVLRSRLSAIITKLGQVKSKSCIGIVYVLRRNKNVIRKFIEKTIAHIKENTSLLAKASRDDTTEGMNKSPGNVHNQKKRIQIKTTSKKRKHCP